MDKLRKNQNRPTDKAFALCGVMRQVCPDCGGTGYIVGRLAHRSYEECGRCNGSGQIAP